MSKNISEKVVKSADVSDDAHIDKEVNKQFSNMNK